jgi:drug/metabolite transporter (DMT)-like permease
MRVAAPAFGPVAMVALRVGIAALVLGLLLGWVGKAATLRERPWPVLWIGVLNSALPFLLFGWALLTIPAGLASVLNATSPIFAALVARVWLGERLAATRWAGMLLGFVGVAVLLSDRIGLEATGRDAAAALAVAACLAGALLYGVSAAFAKRHLAGVEPMAVAAGSQFGASLFAWPFALAAWPSAQPSAAAWWAAGVLGLACTGLA